MIKQVLLLVLVTAAVALPQADVSAQDSYFVPAVVYTDDDTSRAVDDEVGGLQLTVGRFATDWFAIEGTLGGSSLSGSDDLSITELGFNGVFMIDRAKPVSPYFLLGVGILDASSDIFSDEMSGFTNLGFGVNWHIGNGPWSLRAEHRLRTSQERDETMSDRITSLGLSYAFGAKEAPMPVVAADPDSDGDGVPNSRDACPDTPAGHRVDSRGCSLDSDGDGVVDAGDQCPNTYRGAAVDARGCELDDDNDGVINRLDDCPNTAAGVRVDVNGCEIKDVIKLPGVNFETNSDRLLPGADDVLRDAAATLKKYPELVVEVAGHTDSQGAADYNQGLSERRANTVRDYLISAGVNQAKLSARGYGEASPIAGNTTSDGRARNRRVELRIIEE